MSDLIDRQAAIDGKICIQRANGVEIYDDYVVPVEYLKQLPPAQPEPSQVAMDIARIVENGQDMRVIEHGRIKGRWISADAIFGGVPFYCSECGENTRDTVMGKPRWNFCPNCGADMREVTA